MINLEFSYSSRSNSVNKIEWHVKTINSWLFFFADWTHVKLTYEITYAKKVGQPTGDDVIPPKNSSAI